ncbi:MAG: hypothetical protein HC778_00240 [Chamaesiphon sp. CSU_1_12]|nr:hypothetical protein [Chamaesiphon sp. CSU_1_12]
MLAHPKFDRTATIDRSKTSQYILENNYAPCSGVFYQSAVSAANRDR